MMIIMKKEFPFVGRFSIKDNPIIVANDILNTLDIKPSIIIQHNPHFRMDR